MPSAWSAPANTRWRRIGKGAEALDLKPLPVTQFQSLTGRGITGIVDGRRVALGNAQLMAESGITTEAVQDALETLRRQGQTVVLIAVDGKEAGLLGVADPIKKTAPKALAKLHEESCGISARTCFLHSSITRSPFRLPPGFCIRSSACCFSDDCGGRNEPELDFSHCQCTAAQTDSIVAAGTIKGISRLISARHPKADRTAHIACRFFLPIHGSA